MDDARPFDPYLARWRLEPDGPPIRTPTSRLLPVRRGGTPAMLKIALVEEERRGGRQMAWWDGGGAAPVLAHHDDALLMARADDGPDLATGLSDDAASRVLCRVAARLHAPRTRPPPELEPLELRFRALAGAAAEHGGVFRDADAAARALLSEPREVRPLHGDLHHGNVLRFGPRGWLAIDPKGVVGERGFDFANLLLNPSLAVATAPGRLARQVRVIAREAGLERRRLLRWGLAWGGLSAAWCLEDGTDPRVALEVARQAAAELA